ncbi:hypothetical protein HMPREF3203_01718 [Proteus mirabilis]|nr:hypothetical protein HMPREF3203_01718 [Proteus mirabilis]
MSPFSDMKFAMCCFSPTIKNISFKFMMLQKLFYFLMMLFLCSIKSGSNTNY